MDIQTDLLPSTMDATNKAQCITVRIQLQQQCQTVINDLASHSQYPA